MEATSSTRAAQSQINALLVKTGLASADHNSGFQCFFGSGAAKPSSNGEGEGLRVELAAHRRVYHVLDAFSLEFLFTAAESEGDVEITRVILDNRQREMKKLRATRAFKDFIAKPSPTPLLEIEPLLEKLASITDAKLSKLNLELKLDNRIALLNLLWAYNSNRLMHREQLDLGCGPIDYMRAGVDIEHILYAWSRDGWDYTRGQSALPLAEAADLRGVPLSRIKALYPPITGRG